MSKQTLTLNSRKKGLISQMKAELFLETVGEKCIALVALFAVFFFAYPESTALAAGTNDTRAKNEALVFEVKQPNQIFNINTEQGFLTYEELKMTSPDYHLETLLKAYLEKRGSPLANCTTVLLTDAEKNWMKILSLANAESSMGKRYIKSTANMWGVGGAKLWDFGETPCDGVLGMNDFLNNYPRRAEVKYTDWTIEKMNCVYKQPCGMHWVRNNNVILKQLTELKAQAHKLAEEHTKNISAATADITLASQ